MPRVKIDYVVSFSSEDPENPANNLLAREVSKKKWLCKMGESSCSVVLQLAQAVKISAVHIGAYQAAFVEVLVGRSEKPDEQFEVLVPSSVFASPVESRGGAAERVRSFSAAQLAASCAQRWDRLRVVCSQPYNKHCKYGLSFIHVESSEGAGGVGGAGAGAASALTSSLAARLLAAEGASSDEDEFRPGELFRSHAQHSRASTESQIRQASSQALKNIPDSSSRLSSTPRAAREGRASPPPVTSLARSRDSLVYDDSDAQPHAKVDRVVERHRQLKLLGEQQASEAKAKADKKSRDKLDTSTKTKERNKKAESRSTSDSHDDSTSRDKRDTITNSDKRDANSSKYNGSRDKPRDKRDADVSNSDSTRDRRDMDGSSSDRSRDKRDIDTTRDTSRDVRGRADHKRDNAGNTRHDARTTHSSATRGDARKRPRHDNSPNENVPGPRCSSPLRGVVFAISGYVNPERASLRDTGVRLGAMYRRDWDTDCTHLVCAFPNTPKLKQLRAGGSSAPAVLGTWLQHCAQRARRLPWSWHATEPQHRVQEPPADGTESEASDRDTDDEIQEALSKQKKRRRHSPDADAGASDAARPDVPPANADAAASDAAPADADASGADDDVAFVRDERYCGNVTVHDSDSDHTEPGDQSMLTHEIDESKSLPALFEGLTFSVDGSVSRALYDAALMERYILAYGGVIVEEDADYVLCVGAAARPGRAVSPRWLWECHSARTLLPKDCK